MSKLGQAIRSIRKYRGETMTEFAKTLEINHSSVSRYESGKGVPGYKVMLALFDLAQRIGPASVKSFRDALEVPTTPDEKTVQDALEVLSRTPYSGKIRRTEAREISGEVLLLRFFDLAIKCSKHPAGIELLEDAVDRLELSIAGPSTIRERQRPEARLNVPSALQDADANELKVLEDMLAVYRAGDPIVADIRRAAFVLRKHERSAPKPKVAARRNR